MSLVLTPEGTPASPVEGEVYYDSTADKLKVRDSSAFREIVSKNSSGKIDNADFSAGAVVATFFNKYSTSTTLSNTGTYNDIVTVNCTRIGSGNKNIITAIVPVYHYTGGASMSYSIRIRRTTATASTISDTTIHRQNETNTGEMNNVVLMGEDTSLASTTSYTLQISSSTHDSYPIYCYDNNQASILVQEIQV